MKQLNEATGEELAAELNDWYQRRDQAMQAINTILTELDRRLKKLEPVSDESENKLIENTVEEL